MPRHTGPRPPQPDKRFYALLIWTLIIAGMILIGVLTALAPATP